MLGTLLCLLLCPEEVTLQQNPTSICSSHFSSDKQDGQAAQKRDNKVLIYKGGGIFYVRIFFHLPG